MSKINQDHPADETASLQNPVSPNILNALFARINPAHIEQFYQSYQSWILQQKRVALLTQIATLQQKIVEHTEQMQGLAPSVLALASLTQLQAYGVEDIDLLERMLERGEVWLDHTIQLLRRCEQLDVIGSNYTGWCEYALEGAYDWIASIGEDTDETSTALAQAEKTDIDAIENISSQITEELILQKLMSDNEEFNETEEVPVVEVARITQPLSAPDIISLDDECTKIQDPIQELEVEPANLVQEIVVVSPLELLPDSLADDQLISLPPDTEDTETSPSIQAYQPLMELSLNVRPIESIPVEYPLIEYPQMEETVEVDEGLQEEVPMSAQEEQVSLVESDEREDMEVIQEEGVNKLKIELNGEMEMEEIWQEEVLISIEKDRMELLESNKQKLVEEVEEIIDDKYVLHAEVLNSDKRVAVSMSDGTQQVEECDLKEKSELSIFDENSIRHNIANSNEESLEIHKCSITIIQEGKKPQQEVIASERGFLQNLLARIWGR